MFNHYKNQWACKYWRKHSSQFFFEILSKPFFLYILKEKTKVDKWFFII